SGKTQSVYWLNSQYEWQSLCWRQLYAPIESMMGTTFDCTSGKWSLALGRRGGLPSRVKTWVGTLFPPPMAWSAVTSSCVIIPNCGVPSPRSGAASGTTTSWIIQPSYQPDSLLMTKSGSMSVKTSMNEPGSFGSVGRPGFGSRASRTEPRVGVSWFAPVAVGATPSLMPTIVVVNTFGSNPVESSRQQPKTRLSAAA